MIDTINYKLDIFDVSSQVSLITWHFDEMPYACKQAAILKDWFSWSILYKKKTTHALYNYQENNDKSWELKLQLTKYYLVKIGFFDVYSITATLYSIGYSSRM